MSLDKGNIDNEIRKFLKEENITAIDMIYFLMVNLEMMSVFIEEQDYEYKMREFFLKIPKSYHEPIANSFKLMRSVSLEEK